MSIPKRNENTHTKICRSFHSNIIHKNQKVETQVPIYRFIDTQNVVCAYSRVLFSTERSRVLIKVATWMNPPNPVLGERSQAQKAPYYVTPLYAMAGKALVTGSRLVPARPGEEGAGVQGATA